MVWVSVFLRLLNKNVVTLGQRPEGPLRYLVALKKWIHSPTHPYPHTGKSTNLSKVCFWLLQNKLKVLIAACDTFRSGAVEQLRVHARNLQALESSGTVELFDKGYGKDPAGIAMLL